MYPNPTLRGRFTAHHALIVGQILAKVDFLDESIERLSAAIEEQIGTSEQAAAFDTNDQAVQALNAFMSGAAYLAIRIRTRSILPIMVIHALWDFTVFLVGSGGAGSHEVAAGQLGDARAVNSTTPIPVSGGESVATFSSISAGYRHTCAVSNGTGFCWGSNDHGELGDGTLVVRRNRVRPEGAQGADVGVAQPLAQADPAQHLGRQRPRVGAPLQLERQHHVLERVQVAEQLEALENEADLGGTDGSALVLADREQVDAIEADGSRRRRVEPGDQREQRALARPRCADDGDRALSGQGEIDLVENRQRAGRVLHALAEALDGDDGFGHG